MIEFHLDPVGAHARGLTGGLVRRAEGIAAKSLDPDQSKPEYGKRDGDRQGSPQGEETRGGEEHGAAHLAQKVSEPARIGACDQPSEQNEEEQDRATGEEIDHGLWAVSRAARGGAWRPRSGSPRGNRQAPCGRLWHRGLPETGTRASRSGRARPQAC